MVLNEDLDQNIEAYDDKQLFSYDMKIWFNWYIKRLKQIITGNTCLELGIGHGFTTNVFSNYFKHYLVVEGSKKMIERFHMIAPDSKARIVWDYFESFEPNDNFDVILMGYILEHVDNPELILNKYKKYLNPNGTIIVVVPNGSALNRRFGVKAGYLKSLAEVSEFDIKCGHKRTFTYDSLLELTKKCELNVSRCEGIFIKPMSTQQMVDANIPDAIIDAMCEVAVDFPEIASCILLELKTS